MISNLNNSSVGFAYVNSAKNTQQKGSVNTTTTKNSDRIATLKEAISSGDYKVNLETIANKIADELL